MIDFRLTMTVCVCKCVVTNYSNEMCDENIALSAEEDNEMRLKALEKASGVP